MPALACASAAASMRQHASSEANAASACSDASAAGVSLRSTFYVVNPSGDLPSTQSTFEDWFHEQAGWQVVPPLAHVRAAATHTFGACISMICNHAIIGILHMLVYMTCVNWSDCMQCDEVTFLAVQLSQPIMHAHGTGPYGCTSP